MYNTILVPLDGSARAEAILPHVEALAQAFAAKVILLEVVDPAVAAVPPYDYVTVVDDELLTQAVAQADTYLAKLVSDLQAKGIEALEISEAGSPVRTILEVAAREQADLIALASHGRSGLARVFYGSVAAGLLQQTDRALLIIRTEKS